MPKSALSKAITVLPQPNVAEAVAFYRERLAFEDSFVYEEYGGVSSGAVAIHFRGCGEADASKFTECRIEVDNIDSLFAEYQAKGVVKPQDSLELKPWGFREFVIRDPAGNLLTFCQRAADYRA